MTFTPEQKETIAGISTGLHINKGKPCGCGPDDYTTRKEYGYSDSLVFHHKCHNCQNKFSTWIEG